MKKLNLLVISATIFMLLFSMSCKKDEETQPETQDFKVQTVDLPDGLTQSNEPAAQQTVAYANMVNSMAGYGAMMVPPDKSTRLNLKDGGTEVVTWEFSDGTSNYSVTLRITETDTYIKWEMIINGVLDGYQLTNFTYMEAIEYNDGSMSTFTVYDFESRSNILMTMSWWEEGGTVYFTFEVPEDVLLSMEVHPDGSGMLEFKEWNGMEYILDFKAVWTAAGTGEAWYYDNGVEVDYVTW